MAKPEFTVLDPVERSRTYTFPNGGKTTICNVSRLAVSPSGTHRIETPAGTKHIVPSGWIHIEIDADEWTI